MALKITFLILAGFACAASLAQTGAQKLPPGSDRPLPVPMTYLEPKTENGVTYLCGGVGEDEVDAMKQAASGYDLMVTFAASNGAYLAGVDIDIADARGRSLLKTNCDAPIMLVDFDKPGNYRVRADANGHTLTRNAQVRSGGKVRTVAMAWPVKLVDMGATPTLQGGQSSGGSGDAGMSGSTGAGTR
ncbi:MAG: hypothetical protein A3I66_24025 [Burkholderiales bacterium RIFCSPLOWO2_02_FULL_57_36]|nr:MAG: hypothetical protein A3I66_24025 [Burkholderiales bacterium RIFCSPLOWO2_02_FULL_57_36]